jgi:hypothetical protein
MVSRRCSVVSQLISVLFDLGGSKVFRSAPASERPIMRPPTISLDGLGEGSITPLWIQPTVRRLASPGTQGVSTLIHTIEFPYYSIRVDINV